MLTRRSFLASAAAAPLAAQRRAPRLKIGVMDGVLKLTSKPESVGVAKSFGVQGLQATLGRLTGAGPMPLENPDVQARFVAESKKHGLPLAATYIDMLHVSCLKSDPEARRLVSRGIEVTRKLNAGILMTVFFGKCGILNRQELDYVADVFKELAPEAERAGVILGFENVLSAEDNARAMERVNSKAFKVYYDAGNATNMGGFDAPKEIRWLGKDRICQFHLKDKGYLGEGKVDYPAVIAAIAAIGFEGYGVLETNSPSGSMEQDLRRNLRYLENALAATA